jgi:NAD(P)-dependent dehydrogenase (short-subunit alcohol dehydrogenase family)
MGRRNFRNRVVVITGAASGIGLAVAHRFGRAGACLGLLDMDKVALEKSEKELSKYGTKIVTAACDVSIQGQCESAISTIIDHFGGMDVLFNNAGITQRGAFRETQVAVFEKVMAVNFFGSLFCTKAAIESIVSRKGMIIANESIAGVAPLYGRTGYSASKHAMNGLFTSLRSEVRDLGVHVMVVCPGFIQTNLQTRALGGDGKVTTRPQSTIGKQDTPENAADAIFRGAEQEKDLLVLTPIGKLGYWISRIAPAFFERSMVKKLKSELQNGNHSQG